MGMCDNSLKSIFFKITACPKAFYSSSFAASCLLKNSTAYLSLFYTSSSFILVCLGNTGLKGWNTTWTWRIQSHKLIHIWGIQHSWSKLNRSLEGWRKLQNSEETPLHTQKENMSLRIEPGTQELLDRNATYSATMPCFYPFIGALTLGNVILRRPHCPHIRTSHLPPSPFCVFPCKILAYPIILVFC